jgi:hypothetical protein
MALEAGARASDNFPYRLHQPVLVRRVVYTYQNGIGQAVVSNLSALANKLRDVGVEQYLLLAIALRSGSL